MKNKKELRDSFAAKVLAGIYSSNEMYVTMCREKEYNTRDENDSWEDYIAQHCYKMADAMLKEREHSSNTQKELETEVKETETKEPVESSINEKRILSYLKRRQY